MRSLGAGETGNAGAEPDMAGAQDTIYLCNFRVSVDGEWLCLKELQDLDMQESCQELPEQNEHNSPLRDRDPVVIERSNLVNISKLVVKELIEQSLRYGRMLDTDHLPLRHFFIVLEHVLRHGLKPKKGLLGPKKELWDILQTVEKFAPEAQDITASVRDLPTVRTAMGRARAWLRLALMQKKLADYLRVLLEHREQALDEYFEPHALVLSDEAVVIMGLLLGLNVIDCNLCVKEEDLDSQQGVIDFSLYLRGASTETEQSQQQQQHQGPQKHHMAAVLDQKNYIEELNRHLNATVANLQSKVEGLTTTNALMKEDLAIARNSLTQLAQENAQLKHALGQDLHPKDTRLKITEICSSEEEDKAVGESAGNSELARALAEEKNKRQEVTKELELQLCLKAEMEVAMKLLEKDIHDKQDTIVSLRRQLDDIKLINLDMYKKLQECESELTQKGEMVSRLQCKAEQIGKILNNLEKYNHLITQEGEAKVCESSLKHKTELIVKLEEKADSMAKTIEQLDQKLNHEKELRIKSEEVCRTLGNRSRSAERAAAAAEGDLRIEREWRVSQQETMIKDRDRISELLHQVAALQHVEQKNVTLQDELEYLKRQFGEAQTALEEVGGALSSDKLRLAELLEGGGANAAGGGPVRHSDSGTWTSDKHAPACHACHKEFNLTRRRHHCRQCGEVFCAACSEGSAAVEGHARPVRVCDHCHSLLNTST